MSGALDPKIQQEIIDRDLYATAVLSGNRNFDGRIHPYAKQAFLASPPLVVAYAIAGTDALRHRERRAGHRQDGQAGHAEGPLAERRRDRRSGRQAASSPSSSARSTTRCSTFKAAGSDEDQPAVRLARAEHLHPPSAVLGRRAGRRAHAEGHAPAGGAAGQHHHRSPVAVQRDHAGQRRRRIPARRWVCRKKTSIPTRRIAAIT